MSSLTGSNANLPHFSDFYTPRSALTGSKWRLDDVVGKEIVVKAYHTFPSKVVSNKICYQIQFAYEGEDKVVFTTSVVLGRQLEEYADKLPFVATIVKRGRYYTFS